MSRRLIRGLRIQGHVRGAAWYIGFPLMPPKRNRVVRKYPKWGSLTEMREQYRMNRRDFSILFPNAKCITYVGFNVYAVYSKFRMGTGVKVAMFPMLDFKYILGSYGSMTMVELYKHGDLRFLTDSEITFLSMTYGGPGVEYRP